MKIGTLGDESDWVAAAKNAGLVTGMTSTGFQPYTVMRRDQMAAMMCRALGWDDEAAALPATTPGFADVPTTSPYWAAATYLKEQGILQGYPDPSGSEATVLNVDEAIKRQHVARDALPGARPAALELNPSRAAMLGARRRKRVPRDPRDRSRQYCEVH